MESTKNSMFLLLVAGGRSILYTLSNYKPLERNTYHLIQTMTSCRTHHLPESTRPRPFTLEAPWAPYRPFARDLVPPASWCLMNGWKALETTEMLTPQKFRLKLANCGNPTDWEDLLPRQLEDLLQKKFHPAPRNCTLSAELWGLWCHCFGCRISFPPLSSASLVYSLRSIPQKWWSYLPSN